MTRSIIYGMANPAAKVRRSSRRRSKWICTLICDSKAQADRVERFLKRDKAAIKARRAA